MQKYWQGKEGGESLTYGGRMPVQERHDNCRAETGSRNHLSRMREETEQPYRRPKMTARLKLGTK